MAVLTLEFYKPDDGTLLGTLDDTELEACELRASLFELGAGTFTISRHTALDAAGMLDAGVIVIPRSPVINAGAPFWGFVIRDPVERLIAAAEQAGEDVTVTGPGLAAILANATLDEEPHAPSPPASAQRGSSVIPGKWRWIAQKYGGIYLRGVEEGVNEPGAPLALIDPTFTRTVDSDAVAWAEVALGYEVDTGTNLLELGDRLAMAGDFYAIPEPVVASGVLSIKLHAHQSFGTDRSATVQFRKGENILTELERRRQSTRVTHLLVRDVDGVFWPVYESPNAYDQAVWGRLDVPTNDPDTIDKIAASYLAASETLSEEFSLEHSPTLAPFTDYAPGDTVRLHTGDGPGDLDETNQLVGAVRITLDAAVRDGSTVESERSLRFVAELGYRDPSGAAGTNPTASGGGCTCPRPPGTSAAPPPPVIIRSYEVAGPINGMAIVSGHAEASDPPNRVLYAWHLAASAANTPASATYNPTNNPSDYQPMTLIGSVASSGENHASGDPSVLTLWRLINPANRSGGGAWCFFSENDGVAAGTWLVAGADQTAPEADVATAEASASSSSVTPTVGLGDLVLDVMGWAEWSIATGGSTPSVTPTATSGQTVDHSGNFDNPTGQSDPSWGMGHSTGAGARTWSLGTTKFWCAAAIAVKSVDAVIPGDLPDDQVGEFTGAYANAVHYHEHDDTLNAASSDYHVPAGGTTGTVLTKSSGADYDVEWAAGGGGGGGSAAGCDVARSSALTIPQNSGTVITWASEIIDEAAIWDSGNPSRFTAPSDGWYICTAYVKWSALTGLGRQVWWQRSDGTVFGKHSQPADSIHNDPYMNVAATIYLTSGQYVEVYAWRNQSGTCTIGEGRATVVRLP